MAVLVFSLSKSRVTSPKHARRCVAAAVSRISAKKRAGLTWVLMYVLLFFDLSSSPIFCIRTGYHCSQSEARPHYTVRGFGKHGFAQKTIHIFSIRRSIVFLNGGKVWKFGRRRMNFCAQCEVLKYVFTVLSYDGDIGSRLNS